MLGSNNIDSLVTDGTLVPGVDPTIEGVDTGYVQDPYEVAYKRGYLFWAKFTPIIVKTRDRATKRIGWQNEYLKEIPDAFSEEPNANEMSTGILCRGLRAIDIDIDDAPLAQSIERLAEKHFGVTVRRYRENSPRVTLLYRAAEGTPGKRWLSGKDSDGQECKIEVLGDKQQTVIDGLHHKTGVPYRLSARPFIDFERDNLPAITEEQIDAFFDESMLFMGGENGTNRADDRAKRQPYKQFAESIKQLEALDHAAKAAETQYAKTHDSNWFDRWPETFKIDLVKTCLEAIDDAFPELGYPDWRDIGWACKDAEERGATDAFQMFREWSENRIDYDEDEADTEMDNLESGFKAGKIGLGTLLKWARKAGAGQRIDMIAAKAVFSSNPISEIDIAKLNTKSIVEVEPEATTAFIPRYTLARDIAPDVRPHLWQRFIRQESIALMNAPTHTGKTVLAAGLACAVAHGQPFMGRECAQGGVYIVELEGASLVADNVRACHERKGFEQKDNIAIDEEFVNLTNPEVVSELIQSIMHFAACQGGCKLVIIDTLSQAIPGEDENLQKVMSAALQAAQRIKREIGAAVLILHHENKEGESRGSTVLPAGVDTRMRLSKANDVIQVTLEKFKGGRKAPPFYFKIEEVVMRTNIYGEQEGAAIAVHVPSVGVIEAKKDQKRTPGERAILKLLNEAEMNALPNETLKTEFLKECPIDSDKRNTINVTYLRDLKALERAGDVVIEGAERREGKNGIIKTNYSRATVKLAARHKKEQSAIAAFEKSEPRELH